MEMYSGGCNRWRVVWFLVTMMMQECAGHIRLTYPPARKYQFDFLDNVRTKVPCGMPKGLDNSRTNLQAGSQLDVHWHLSYPHWGGFFFELLDQNEIVKARFPDNGFIGSEDITTLNASITLPDEPCDDCTLRMARQAREWSVSYLFHSCADVNIMQAMPMSDMCSGHGAYYNGECACERLYKGDKCQFKEECEEDSDCGVQGKCIDTKATSYPVHQCYCKRGWFGSRCQSESSVKNKPDDISVYTPRVMGSGRTSFTLYYRIVEDEVEVMVKAKTATWVGLGWRPGDADKSCRTFPDVGDPSYIPEVNREDGEAENEPVSEGENNGTAEHHDNSTYPEGEGEAEGEQGAAGEGESTAENHSNSTYPEGEGGAEGEQGAAGEGESTAEHPSNSTYPEGEGGAEGEQGAAGEGESTAEHHSNSTYPEGEGGAEGEQGAAGEGESTAEHPSNSTYPEGEGGAEGEQGAAGEGESTAEHPSNSTYPEGEGGAEGEQGAAGEGESTAEHPSNSTYPEGEGGAEGGAGAEGEPDAEGEPEAEGGGKGSGLHAMDCTDIVIGSAKGQYSRIGDYYTRDRSTPVHDEYLGGSNGLTAGLVWEEGQNTYMLFRKRLQTDDSADHSLEDEPTHVIWAMGQQQDQDGRYNHNPELPLNSPNVSVPMFYKEDELKYHGHQGQRGSTMFNLFPSNDAEDDDEPCMQGTCPKNKCGLDFSWTYDPDTDLITFSVSDKYLQPDQWLALGFSKDFRMEDTDVVYGGMDADGEPFVMSGWLSEKAQPDTENRLQEAKLVSGVVSDKRTTLIFTRPRITQDKEQAFSLDQCLYVVFAKGGSIFQDKTISRHFNTPNVPPEKFCFGVCKVLRATPVIGRFPDVVFKDTYRVKTSPDYRDIVSAIKPKLVDHFKTNLGPIYNGIRILDFKSGSLIVEFEVLTKTTFNVSSVQENVESAAGTLNEQSFGSYGVLEIDQVASTYTATDGATTSTPPPMKRKELLSEVEIIIIAVVLALVLVAILIGVCKFLEMRRTKRVEKQRMMNSREGSSGSGESRESGDSTKKTPGTITYGQFMASAQENHGDPSLKHYHHPHHPPPYPAFVNPGYETAGYKVAP